MKDRDPARVDNPFLIEELSEERPGILVWMLEGLHRLLANRYQFTISERSIQNLEAAMAEQTPDSIITTQRNGQTIVAELFFNHSSTETFRDKLLKLVLADSSRLSASDGQEPEKTEILR